MERVFTPIKGGRIFGDRLFSQDLRWAMTPIALTFAS